MGAPSASGRTEVEAPRRPGRAPERVPPSPHQRRRAAPGAAPTLIGLGGAAELSAHVACPRGAAAVKYAGAGLEGARETQRPRRFGCSLARRPRPDQVLRRRRGRGRGPGAGAGAGDRGPGGGGGSAAALRLPAVEEGCPRGRTIGCQRPGRAVRGLRAALRAVGRWVMRGRPPGAPRTAILVSGWAEAGGPRRLCAPTKGPLGPSTRGIPPPTAGRGPFRPGGAFSATEGPGARWGPVSPPRGRSPEPPGCPG